MIVCDNRSGRGCRRRHDSRWSVERVFRGGDGGGGRLFPATGVAAAGQGQRWGTRRRPGCSTSCPAACGTVIEIRALGGVFPCQVGVMAAWATGIGQALIDRELYLPREWTQDRERCRRARVPDRVGFAVKPRLAEQMIDRAVPDLPQGQVWVATDEVYGRDGAFRRHLEDHDLPYVVTVQANQSVLPRPGWRHIARLVERCAAEDEWVELPAGPSQLDSRTWQWWVRRIPAPDAAVGSGRARWLLARRRPETPDERDYYLRWGPEDTSVEDLVLVPGARWRVEEAIKLAKSAAGMADYEVRHFHGWYRHITLSQLAAAFLAVQAAAERRGEQPGIPHRGPAVTPPSSVDSPRSPSPPSRSPASSS
ncbi:IS701 family transposase [Streptomyces sp. NPDC006476]|uniref:IS701 family transposase n=1 Tax=Streptomyces sp. NPDC006476 TaxID=3157175 RepID=UPI0033BC7D18